MHHTLGDRIRTAREELGISLSDLAASANCDEALLEAVETGRVRELPLYIVSLLSKPLERTVQHLLKGSSTSESRIEQASLRTADSFAEFVGGCDLPPMFAFLLWDKMEEQAHRTAVGLSADTWDTYLSRLFQVNGQSMASKPRTRRPRKSAKKRTTKEVAQQPHLAKAVAPEPSDVPIPCFFCGYIGPWRTARCPGCERYGRE